jgi:hypothetical protein
MGMPGMNIGNMAGSKDYIPMFGPGNPIGIDKHEETNEDKNPQNLCSGQAQWVDGANIVEATRRNEATILCSGR